MDFSAGIEKHVMDGSLFETPDNPLPGAAVSGMVDLPDGKRIRYARFAATGRPLQGTVVIVPGRNDYIEKYFETIADLSTRGFSAVIFDLRGQGGSDRLLHDPNRGYIADFQDYANDLGPLFEQIVLPDARGPYYILAHSTGALVTLLAAHNLYNRVERMVLLAPLLGFYGHSFGRRNAAPISSFLHAAGLGSVYVSGGPPDKPMPFNGNPLTSDPRRYGRNTNLAMRFPELTIGGPTATWARAASKAIARVKDPEFMAQMRVPALLIAAGLDTVVSTPATEDYARRMRNGALITIDGARHELLHEADIFREQVLAAFDAFIPGSD
jgi:lysophospholipase